MSLSSTSIKRPVLAIVMNLSLVLFGLIGFHFLGVREFPSIDPPVVSVRTGYPGANADVIESQITEPLEKAINSIDGVRNISSSSNQGSSNITVEFNLTKDLEEATNDVRDKVSQAARSLPKDIDGLPVVAKADANSESILSMTLESDTRNQLELSDYAENVLAQRLQTIPGVSNVQIWGQKRIAMRIWIDPSRMAACRLTALDIKTALDKENIELPSGKITGESTELSVKTMGNLSSEDDFNNLIIKLGDKKYQNENPSNSMYSAEYYRGLNYLLNNEDDKALKIFTDLIDVDSSTIETHLALGGVMMNCGYDRDPSGRYDLPPIAPQLWHSYHIAGEQLSIGIMAALCQ